MAITSAICNSFKEEILQGGHCLNASGSTAAGNTIKCALYSANDAVLSASTTQWTVASDPTADPTNTYEVTTTGSGYSSGGNTLTSTTPVVNGDSACCLFATTSWGSTASFTARGCLIYNSSASNKSVCSINFGADKTVTSGTFTIEFPAQTAGNAIIEIT